MRVRILHQISEISDSSWSSLAAASCPFLDHAYLAALERSGSLGESAGWMPRHITLWEGDLLVGASPFYAKSNSYGEYIFDWEWARAYYQHGRLYYPKLTSAVPFTPATASKLMVSPGTSPRSLIEAAMEMLPTESASSLHYLFLPEAETQAFESPWLVRHSFQYHWRNREYRDFSDFLSTLKSRKAKSIRREREQLAEAGLEIRVLHGSDLTPAHAQSMHELYLSTIAKMGAIDYLKAPFFELVFSTMKDNVHFVVAERAGKVVAGALFYSKGDTLFGRNWGAFEEVRHLHFELCYYQGIELAIRSKRKLFEAGAQGEHKIARGFLPELTYSAHYICDPAFRKAIGGYVEQEKQGIASLFEQFRSLSPYGEVAR